MSGENMMRRVTVVACFAATTAVSSHAHAQAGDAKPEDHGSTQVGEVIVTAERRETRLQDTPIAVSAVSGVTIQQQRLVNLSEIANKIPSITFTR
ncbi:MAG: TonB-dependent receptor-like protein [Caulobacteraceae bacterium]|jgi:iron complex outermembrane receptor protein|nr:TonB-dependent receptor-like protein [Caulobacteraceae bacterium]